MKLDTSRIENYENMTAEEKVQALESLEVDYSGYVEKKLFDKTASELASLKKQNRELLSTEERIKKEQEDEFNEMKLKLEALENEKKIGEITAQFLSLGYDNQLAKDTAEAVINGDNETVFKNQKAHQDAMQKRIKMELAKGTPEPQIKNDQKTMTLDKLRSMDIRERMAFQRSNPEEYKALYENEK